MARQIEYRFKLENGSAWNYVLNFDEVHRFLPDTKREVKPWTRLQFQKCPNCPLKESDHPQCPVARNLDQIVEDSKDTISYTKAEITIETPERSYSKNCATQEGLRSLFGVVMASSGCPHLDWLRPLARFHLPFSSTDETLFRVLSLQLLNNFLNKPETSLAECATDVGLHYKEIQTVNRSFMERIRSYCKQDADKNAMVSLYLYAELFPFHVEDDFAVLRKFFEKGDSAPDQKII